MTASRESHPPHPFWPQIDALLQPWRINDIAAIAEKWELEAALIGYVTDDGMFRVRDGEAVVAEIPGTDGVGPAVVAVPLHPHPVPAPGVLAALRLEDPGASLRVTGWLPSWQLSHRAFPSIERRSVLPRVPEMWIVVSP